MVWSQLSGVRTAQVSWWHQMVRLTARTAGVCLTSIGHSLCSGLDSCASPLEYRSFSPDSCASPLEWALWDLCWPLIPASYTLWAFSVSSVQAKPMVSNSGEVLLPTHCSAWFLTWYGGKSQLGHRWADLYQKWTPRRQISISNWTYQTWYWWDVPFR